MEILAQTDSLYMDLDSAMFSSYRHTSALKSVAGNELEMDLSQIQSYPKILGNTDPMNMLKYFAGVQTASEYDSGIHIQGCDNAHNYIASGGVPVYGANHLFGLFSVFNPSHYPKMKFRRSVVFSSVANRLGGYIDMMLPDSLDGKVSGDFAIGIMSAQGTLSFKAGKRSFIHLSARKSFLNLLYGRWLKVDGNPMRYSFGDYNLTYHIDAGSRDKIWIDAYLGNDKAFLGASNYNVDLGVAWGNHLEALHWEHTTDDYVLNQTIYISGYGVDASLYQAGSSLKVPSSIGTAGYKGKMKWKDFVSGTDVTLYKVRPQAPEKNLNGNMDADDSELQTAAEFDVYTDYSVTLGERLEMNAGVKASCYISPENKTFWGLSPAASISYEAYQLGKVTASYSYQHQYLFQTGLSNIGLPIDFWFMAGSHSLPQSAQSCSLGYEVGLKKDMYRISLEAYGKRLYNQVEYNGDLFDLLNSEYDLDRYLLKGDGMNYGVNLMIHKQSGSLTGWISCAVGRALRTFDDPDYPSVYPASHERIYELNALCSYEYEKWQFSGTFVCAGGTPFTAPESFYLSAGNLITKYGEYNSSRLRPYIRMDLSINFSFRKDGRQENGLNLSVYNVLARKNEIMWRLNIDEGTFSYRPMTFFMRMMPSISYYHKF